MNRYIVIAKFEILQAFLSTCLLSTMPFIILLSLVVFCDLTSTFSVIGIKILIMGHFLLTLRISMGHSLIFCVNISDFNGTFSDGM
jgi:hypothetical protein